jgi:hypothetical protein
MGGVHTAAGSLPHSRRKLTIVSQIAAGNGSNNVTVQPSVGRRRSPQQQQQHARSIVCWRTAYSVDQVNHIFSRPQSACWAQFPLEMLLLLLLLDARCGWRLEQNAPSISIAVWMVRRAARRAMPKQLRAAANCDAGTTTVLSAPHACRAPHPFYCPPACERC